MLALLLILQLLFSGLHHHDSGLARDDHCVACEITALIGGALPSLPLTLVTVLPPLCPFRLLAPHSAALSSPRYRLAWSAAP